jgi:hypothetical protein
MPRVHKDEAPVLVDTPVIQGRYAELGDYTVSFETFPEDSAGAETIDFSPTKLLQDTMAVIAVNMAAREGAL